MGIVIPGKTVFLIETAPRRWCYQRKVCALKQNSVCIMYAANFYLIPIYWELALRVLPGYYFIHDLTSKPCISRCPKSSVFQQWPVSHYQQFVSYNANWMSISPIIMPTCKCKPSIAVILWLVIRSWKLFAHPRECSYLCHRQNCVVITSL